MDRAENAATVRLVALRWFVAGLVLLTAAFALPLYHWARLAMAVDLHSHTILIPFVSGYLIWQRREQLPGPGPDGRWWGGGLALVATIFAWLAWNGSEASEPQDRLALQIGAYVLAGVGVAWACFGLAFMKAILFPTCFLVFILPVPQGLENMLEVFLQGLSADASNVLFWMFGETYLRDGQVFVFPGLTIRVAQECSGIRSSLVLFILSWLAANQFLHTPWRRVLLVMSVLPLGIIRNAFRVYVITALTLHYDPTIIDSPLHHRGGPIFFALSLIPFVGLVWLLRWNERSSAKGRTMDSP